MVDAPNLSLSPPNGDRTFLLPDLVVLQAEEARRIPSPGTQRALKAETGKTFEELVSGDGADRIQTLIWAKLRKEFPGLRWADCAEVDVQIEEGFAPLDPTTLAVSGNSPPSAASGG